MATNPGLLAEWPWERLGGFKYILYLPILATAVRRNIFADESSDVDNFNLHLLIVSLLRYFQGQIWMTVTRMHDVVDKHRVQDKSIKFEQLDREENWEDFILLNALMFYVYHGLSLMQVQPTFNLMGFFVTVLWHMGPVEFVYYWFHRLLHHHYLFRRYHSHHHSSFQTQALTGNVHPFAEHIAYALLFGSPFLINSLLGTSSIALLYVYLLVFDFLNNIGHCNWEFLPTSLFQAFPPLKYLLYTPSFHSLHHTQVHTNFCLFMPLYDYLYQTVDRSSDSLHLTARRGKEQKVEFVYLTHPRDLLSIFHFSIGIPSFACRPYAKKWYIRLLYPIAFPIMLILWISGIFSFAIDEHTVENLSMHVWAIPRFNFQYKIASERSRIKKLIEKSIFKAQSMGAKVICLGLHNKDIVSDTKEALFQNPDLRIRIVDGSTLTAAVVVNKIPKNLDEVFIIGIEDKIGAAIALYLSTRREATTTVKVLYKEESAYEGLRKLDEDVQVKLLRVHSLEEGRTCKAWVTGKPLSSSEQAYAPSGTCFYEFSDDVYMDECREDCSYAKLPAMHLPPGVNGLRACEGELPRGVVRASHAGGILHALKDWSWHEFGNSINVAGMDSTLQAAFACGFVSYY